MEHYIVSVLQSFCTEECVQLPIAHAERCSLAPRHYHDLIKATTGQTETLMSDPTYHVQEG